jgi:peptidoglycan-associated lipoprotein
VVKSRNIALRTGMAFTLLAMVICGGGCAKRVNVKDMTADGRGGNNPGGASDGSGKDGATGDHSDATEDQLGLRDVFFAFDDATLASDARSTLARNGDVLKEHTGLRVTIEGHCDERGTVEYNLALGQLRADAAKNYLINLGLDSGRFTTISYGETSPFVSGTGEAVWSQNRRAHFAVSPRP